MTTKIGIKELAAHLDISIASVSRALHNPTRVSINMRERVQAAAIKLGYEQNTLASGLRSSRTYNILAIIPKISDPFISGVIDSMEANAAQRGYSVLFCNSQGKREKELEYGKWILNKRADGVIYFSETPPFSKELMESDGFVVPPMVNSCEVNSSTSAMLDSNTIPFVTIDNEEAAYEITKHLIDQGHHRIAVITGGRDLVSSRQRLSGYRKALKHAGIAVDNKLILDGDYTLENGERLAYELLTLEPRPTAVFCMSDVIAIGCMHSLKKEGVSIPEDIAVAGIDNIRFASYCTPPLTTVAQPVEDIGKICVKLLIDIIEKNKIDDSHIILPHKLVLRESTLKR